MAALEGKFAALDATASADEQSPVLRQLFKIIGAPLRKAETFAWTAECRQAVEHVAKSVPLTTTFEKEEAFTPAWHWFDETGNRLPIIAINATEHPDITQAHLCALLIRPVRTESGRLARGFVAFVRPSAAHAPLPFLSWSWMVGEPLADALANIVPVAEARDKAEPTKVQLARNCTCFIAAADAWFRQRILMTAPGPVERHRRKQLAREFALDAPVADVKVIHLRRTEYEPHGSGEHRSVDWHCRWVVTGHWRHQACGTGLSERRLIYVWSYPKGPADKPLRVPVATVNLVDR